MCGLTGFLVAPSEASGRAEDMRSLLSCMAGTLSHRGPDDGGFWIDAGAGVALGHRRLSIIDLSPSGRQPMTSACGRYVAAFNGEIYNFKILRGELERAGHAFRGTSDTEVLLASVSEYGVAEAPKRWNGMFALALWDREARVLSLVRDRFGEKPLYYGESGGTFLFGSELKALKAHPSFCGEIDDAALASYFRYNFVPTPLSIYRGISKQPAATIVAVSYDAVKGVWTASKPEPYWSAREAALKACANPLRASENDAANELEALLSDAIRMRMESDVPLGAFLSGGIDSSTVVALMQKEAVTKVKTFSIGFAEATHDESAEAEAVARVLGTEHDGLTVTAQDALGVVSKLPRLYDEPFADSSQIPTFLVSEFARRRVTVSLSGDGGDEMFGGYTRHLRAEALWRTLSRCPRILRRCGGGALRWIPPTAWDRLASVFFGERHLGEKAHKMARALDMPSAFQFYLSLISPGAGSDLVLAKRSDPDLLERALEEAWDNALGMTENMMFCDAIGYLEGDILAKVDRASMGVGLEARVPFLDHRVFEFAWRLPISHKIRGGVGKIPLRTILGRYVPARFFDRPKTGFHMPVGEWLRGPLKDWAAALLDADKIEKARHLRVTEVGCLWREHQSGAFDHGERLWGVLMFQAWLEGGGA